MAALRKLGRYELVRTLGKGAMGVVYEGLDPALGRRVAIKTILKSAGLDADTERAYAQRFTQEAGAVARLNHPHIVQVYDFGVEGDVAYLVMEFIEGRELRSLFEAGEKIDTGEAVRIMCELLEALEFAHQAGVIHRDVKPANVMLDTQRRAKLADFGVARIQEGERTQADTMVGSPAYMSPEQISGVKIDHRTDIFAAGIILYQFLTGAKPFRGEGSWAVLAAIAQEEPAAPSEVTGGIPQAFDEVVARALAKKPAERFATAREFAAALRDALGQPIRPSAPRKPARPTSEAELEFWRSIQNTGDPAELETYIAQFPDGTYTALARVKLVRLRETGTQPPAGLAALPAADAIEATAVPAAGRRRRASAVAALAAGTALAAAGAAYLWAAGRRPRLRPLLCRCRLRRWRRSPSHRRHRWPMKRRPGQPPSAWKKPGWTRSRPCRRRPPPAEPSPSGWRPRRRWAGWCRRSWRPKRQRHGRPRTSWPPSRRLRPPLPSGPPPRKRRPISPRPGRRRKERLRTRL